MAANWLYGFSAAQIQAYVLSSPLLRDIQGASHLVETLCKERFLRVAQLAGLEPRFVLSQAAGAARLLVPNAAESALRQLMAVWPFVADSVAPGLLIEQALLHVPTPADLASAQRDLERHLRASRSAPPVVLPEAGPLVAWNPRSGEPAIPEHPLLPGDERDGRVDRNTLARRRAWKALQGGRGALDARLLPRTGQWRFVSREEEQRFLAGEGSPYVGVVHADGNRIGRAVEKVVGGAGRSDPARAFRAFSGELELASEEATREAVEGVLAPAVSEGVLPARPILLGGDDLCILVRADLAVPFAERFLRSFAERTRARFEVQPDLRALSEGLTACAGVALVKHAFPFDRGHALAEGLARLAKAGLPERPGRGAVCFLRVIESLGDSARSLVESEYTRGDRCLTLVSYGVQPESPEQPSLEALWGLVDALPPEQGSAIHEVMLALESDPDLADARWARLCQVARKRTGGAPIERLRRALATLTGDPDRLWRRCGSQLRTPLLDALTLQRVAGRSAPTGHPAAPHEVRR